MHDHHLSELENLSTASRMAVEIRDGIAGRRLRGEPPADRAAELEVWEALHAQLSEQLEASRMPEPVQIAREVCASVCSTLDWQAVDAAELEVQALAIVGLLGDALRVGIEQAQQLVRQETEHRLGLTNTTTT